MINNMAVEVGMQKEKKGKDLKKIIITRIIIFIKLSANGN